MLAELVSVCMHFTLDKILSKMFLFTTHLRLLVIPFRIASNSAGPGNRQSTTDSAHHVEFQHIYYVLGLA